MAVDYGTKRIGLALTDALQSMAHPFKVIARKKNSDLIKELQEISEEHDVEKIIVGLPLHADGGESTGSAAARKFAAILAETTGLCVRMWDERYSSVSAEEFLVEEADVSRKRRKKLIDKLAASFILQSYLEHERSKK